VNAISELRQLPVEERLGLIESLWNSILEDQNSLPDAPAVVQELRERRARFQANPASGLPWAEALHRIRSARG